VGILIPANFSSSISAGRQGNLTIFYDPANGRALEGVSVIQGVADGFSQRIATQRLLVKNVTKADITPIGINQSPLGSEKESKAILAAGGPLSVLSPLLHVPRRVLLHGRRHRR
jgi:hypothetical protein